jgi:Na+/H+ antiporter NhaD/arsenite permease-like protein
MCGAGIALFVMACMGEFRDIQEVVIFIDESTLALLFGMMIIVYLISTTGVFEYVAIRALEFR